MCKSESIESIARRGKFQEKLGKRRGPFDPYPPILDPLPLVDEDLDDTKPTKPFPEKLLEDETPDNEYLAFPNRIDRRNYLVEKHLRGEY